MCDSSGSRGGLLPPSTDGPKFSQFHAIIWKMENLSKSYVGAPPRILDPPLCRLGLFVPHDEATVRSHGGCETQKQHKSILSKFGSLVTRLNTNIHQGKFNKTKLFFPLKTDPSLNTRFFPRGM